MLTPRSFAAASLRAVLLIARWLHAADLVRATMPERGGRVFSALLRLAIRQHRELALLRRRLARVQPARRPRFRPVERKDILEFGDQFGFSARRLAKAFLVTPETIGLWKRAVARGRAALVRPASPLRAFRDLVAETARLLRRAHPHWGTRRIAGTLARLGLQAARSTVQRALRRPPPRNAPAAVVPKRRKLPPGIRPKRPHHVWIMDFSTLSVFFGCLTVRVGAVLDSFSRKIVAISLCPGEPDAKWTCRLLQDGIRNAGARPAHVITDKGCQFRSKSFRRHLSRRGIRHRFVSVL